MKFAACLSGMIITAIVAGGALLANKKTVEFRQEWTTSRSVEDSFDLVRKAFLDSRSSRLWPNQYSVLRAESDLLEKGTRIEAEYKIGPANSKASYFIKDFQPPNVIAYETTPEHALKGGAKISFWPVSSGKTLILWEGSYERKDLKGAFALFWFERFFAKSFFDALKSVL